jgi:hypothetical protein
MREIKSIKLSIIFGALLGMSIVCLTALGQVADMNKNAIALTPVEKLGKFMLYDHTLSNPSGYACATCHLPEAGFTGPDSLVNLFGGPQPGVVPGRFSNRKPQSYVYAAFCPVGPAFNAIAGVWIGGDFWDGRVPDLSGQVSIDFPTARHPQTLLATHHNGQPLTVEQGAPLRLLAPMKIGLKNIKAITQIYYTVEEPTDYWSIRGNSKYQGI